MEKIVVGVDGSQPAQRGLEWAVAQASVRGARLVVVHAWQPSAAVMSPYGATLADPVSLADTARAILADSVASVDTTSLAIVPELRLVQGPAAPALIDAARGGALLVVGSRGRGGFAGLLLGSVSQQIAQHATVPVVIVPPGTTNSRAEAAGGGRVGAPHR
ncbi:nucleotide-binding universal stress UspA family protein [Kribbella voronezhensis]|uniref:Nucleotide-binding universal stress UspA family protein n=1 Tax=Kribbella voronezhensis TaxID=2512212 RepID=A0A4R7T932_9ACTN|nr:universal stress protein [Kribbella voronezhensis]TDU87856.1 nucleotide-binding universal stress UspA family protein [Kribbella voronezhensis]